MDSSELNAASVSFLGLLSYCKFLRLFKISTNILMFKIRQDLTGTYKILHDTNGEFSFRDQPND